MKRITAVLVAACFVIVFALTGCMTTQAIKAGGGVAAIATASCQDLQLTLATASSATAWTKIYYPNKDSDFAAKVEPALKEADTAVQTYCDAVAVATNTTSVADLLAQQAKVAAVIQNVNQLIADIKAN